MNIVYISDSYLDLSIFMSQVHTLCNYHSKQNNIKLIALCSHRDMKLDKPNDAKYELIKIYRYPRMFIPSVNKLRALTISNKIRREFEHADIIHCRGHVGSLFAVNLLKRFNLDKKVIADIRGAIVEEKKSSQVKLSNFYSLQSKKTEEIVFAHAYYFFFVSNNMQKYYKEKYKFKQNSAVFPTIVNEEFFYKSIKLRNEYRDKLNVKDKQVYIYVGGADYWQNLDKIILKFNELSIKEVNKYFFIIITNEINFVKDFSIKNNIDLSDFYIGSLAYSDVCKYLNASDYGVIVRNSSVINYVASPTKINEYLACELKVINSIDQIGINNTFLNQEYKSTDKIINEQNEIFYAIAKAFD